MITKTDATVLFVKDLDKCTKFYRDVFKLKYKGSDETSSYFEINPDLFFILLSPEGKEELIGQDTDQNQSQGSPKCILAARVEDVDVAYNELKAQSVEFVMPPMDRRWGRRTAHFKDPEGNIWEINQIIKDKKLDGAKKTE